MRKFTGIEYLYIDIANQYGLDKTNWDTRIQWTTDNLNDLETLTNKAEDRYLYIKAVAALRDTENNIHTGHLMGLDATASGIQIMAAVMGCPVSAANVNLTNTGEREDIYGKVATKMQKHGVNIQRSAVKKPIMTTFYGSKKQPETLFGKNTVELEAFYFVLENELPGAMELMGIMQSCWNPTALQHKWVMPDKHVVIAKVLKPTDKKIEVDELGHATFTHRAITNQADPHGLSLAANIIHSIDGWIVREMVRRTHNMKIDMVTIHDSFWTHPNDMNIVRQLYIDLMCEIADSDMMENILNQITGQDDTLLKKTTNLSTLIKDSEYALS